MSKKLPKLYLLATIHKLCVLTSNLSGLGCLQQNLNKSIVMLHQSQLHNYNCGYSHTVIIELWTVDSTYKLSPIQPVLDWWPKLSIFLSRPSLQVGKL